MIDTVEKNVASGVSVVQQQQQLSIEILTNLSIKLLLIPGIIANLLF